MTAFHLRQRVGISLPNGDDNHGDDDDDDDEHGDDENLAISSKVSPPSCRPARSNTICFQSEQKSETIFHQNGKYQNSHLPCFIKQDLGKGGHGLYFVFPWQVKIQ